MKVIKTKKGFELEGTEPEEKFDARKLSDYKKMIEEAEEAEGYDSELEKAVKSASEKSVVYEQEGKDEDVERELARIKHLKNLQKKRNLP